ncbi:hypothetical protein ACFS5M_10660 [Lacinutrix iliipiscaria]|uniref:Uncharacterized protein n=1 Tax=Lacinutrix iliipiscaria TaxID=1230532 RepID=A0ABW5WQ94_9FLAO
MKQIYVNKNFTLTIVNLLLVMLTYSVFAQNTVYSTIAKNIHPDGRSLHHDLNAAGDTLHLKSNYKLFKVEFMGNNESKVFMIEGSKSEAFIPLASVPVGEYTIAGFQIERSDDIYQYQKTIIFRISRLLPIPTFQDDVIADVAPEIIKDEPIIEKATSVAEINKEAPIIEEANAVAEVKLPEPEKKKRLKKAVKPKNKSAIASHQPVSKSFVESRRPKAVKEQPTSDLTTKASRLVETKEPRLDTTEYKSYNLSTRRGGRYVVQSRAEYRRNNLRPNGQPYN